MMLQGVDEQLADSILIELTRHLPEGFTLGTIKAVVKNENGAQVVTVDRGRNCVFWVNTGGATRYAEFGAGGQEVTNFELGHEGQRMIRYDPAQEA